jgi:hypothetical protein
LKSYSNNRQTSFTANDSTQGGTINLPALATISTSAPLDVDAEGASSAIDLASLTAWAVSEGGQSSLVVTKGATVDDGGLTTLTGVAVTLDGTGKLAIGQWKSLTDGAIRVDGGAYPPATGANASNSFTALTDIDGSGLYVSGGGSLTLPGVATYTDNSVYSPGFEVTDTASGGRISLPQLKSISGYESFVVEAAGTASQIDLPALTSFVNTDARYGDRDTLSVTKGATVQDGGLTSLTGVNVRLDGTGKLATRQWTSVIDGALTIAGGRYTSPTKGTSSGSFAGLTDINGSGLYVSGGGSLTLPGVQAYDGCDLRLMYWSVPAGGEGSFG